MGTLNELAAAYFFLKKYEQSIESYQKLLQISPEFKQARIWLSRVYWEGKKNPVLALSVLGESKGDTDIENLKKYYHGIIQHK